MIVIKLNNLFYRLIIDFKNNIILYVFVVIDDNDRWIIKKIVFKVFFYMNIYIKILIYIFGFFFIKWDRYFGEYKVLYWNYD